MIKIVTIPLQTVMATPEELDKTHHQKIQELNDLLREGYVKFDGQFAEIAGTKCLIFTMHKIDREGWF